jgi:hypothetical protein
MRCEAKDVERGFEVLSSDGVYKINREDLFEAESKIRKKEAPIPARWWVMG